ncbi:hypothetical protein M8J77_003556 [Diaphorina citri]|nr:hypothetical protein M8J77_003556 [Diaphorina citri]
MRNRKTKEKYKPDDQHWGRCRSDNTASERGRFGNYAERGPFSTTAPWRLGNGVERGASGNGVLERGAFCNYAERGPFGNHVERGPFGNCAANRGPFGNTVSGQGTFCNPATEHGRFCNSAPKRGPFGNTTLERESSGNPVSERGTSDNITLERRVPGSMPADCNYLNSEIENLFNTYTHQNNIAMGGSHNNPLLDNELASDVTFLAGVEPEVWRIPGHRRLLADKNSVFEAMFFGALAGNRTEDPGVVHITDVSGRAFDYFIKFLYNDDIEFLTVPSTLDILHVADKYLCTNLIRKCVFYLDQHLSVDNVLDIYASVQIYADASRGLGHLVPSAPPAEEVLELNQQREGQFSQRRGSGEEGRIKAQYKSILDLMQPGNESPETITRILNMLCYNCLLFIDHHAQQIFTSLRNVDSIPSIHSLCQIFSRPCLQIQDELALYKFLNAYVTNTLKQTQTPISVANKRRFLTEQNCDRILFTIKYLTMDRFEEFISYLHDSETNTLFHEYEVDFLIYLRQNNSHLYMIAQNLANNPQESANNNDASRVNENTRNCTKRADNGRSLQSWENFNLSHIDVIFLAEQRASPNEMYLPLSLRSLPKIKPKDEAHGQEKIATCKSKEKRKFAEYVWTVLAFIFD